MTDQLTTLKLPALLPEAEAARRLGLKPRSLRSERASGRLPHRRVAGKVFYTEADLAAFIENSLCPARAAPKPASSQPRTVSGFAGAMPPAASVSSAVDLTVQQLLAARRKSPSG